MCDSGTGPDLAGEAQQAWRTGGTHQLQVALVAVGSGVVDCGVTLDVAYRRVGAVIQQVLQTAAGHRHTDRHRDTRASQRAELGACGMDESQ